MQHFIFILTIFFLFKENGNSTESSKISNDDIWKPRMREVRFESTGLTVYYIATESRCHNYSPHNGFPYSYYSIIPTLFTRPSVNPFVIESINTNALRIF